MSKELAEEFRFEVAFSYAGGEKQEILQEVAALLQEELGDGKVFFDQWFIDESAGQDGQLYLQEIYKNESRMIVVCICKDYNESPWAQEEMRAIMALERELRDVAKGNVKRLRILPVRFDKGEVDGYFKTALVADVRGQSAEEIKELILRRHQKILIGGAANYSELDSVKNQLGERGDVRPSRDVQSDKDGATEERDRTNSLEEEEKSERGTISQDLDSECGLDKHNNRSISVVQDEKRADEEQARDSDPSQETQGYLPRQVLLFLAATVAIVFSVGGWLLIEERPAEDEKKTQAALSGEDELPGQAESPDPSQVKEIDELSDKGLVALKSGDNIGAIDFYMKACFKAEAVFAGQGYDAAGPCVYLIEALIRAGRYDDAIARIAVSFRAPYAEESKGIRSALFNMKARVARKQGLPQLALSESELAVDLAVEAYGNRDPELYNYRVGFSRDLRWNGKYEEALDVLDELVEMVESGAVYDKSKEGRERLLVELKWDRIIVLYNQGVDPRYFPGSGLNSPPLSPCYEALRQFQGIEEIEALPYPELKHKILADYGVAAHCASMFSDSKDRLWATSVDALEKALVFFTSLLNKEVESDDRRSAEILKIEEVAGDKCWSGSLSGQPIEADYPSIARIVSLRLAMARVLISKGPPDCACTIADGAQEFLKRIGAGQIEFAKAKTLVGACLIAKRETAQGEEIVSRAHEALRHQRPRAYSTKYADGLLKRADLFVLQIDETAR